MYRNPRRGSSDDLGRRPNPSSSDDSQLEWSPRWLGLPLFVAVLVCSSVASPAVPNDVNGDSVLDVSDVQCGVLTVLKPVAPSCLAAPNAADINCDFVTDVVDVQILVLVVLKAPENGVPVALDGNHNNIVDSCEWLLGCGDLCGNGIVEKENDEECDDGDCLNGDGCDQWCKVEGVCCWPSPCCCDGKKDPGEECDDANDKDGDGCSKTCKLE